VGYSSSRETAKGGTAGKAAAASLTPLASVGAVASIRPDESVIQMGKVFKLAINDERLRPTAGGVFQLHYDPQVLEFRTILNGEVIQSAGTGEQASGSPETQAGTVAFKVAPSARPAGGRTVTVTFYAKAPGVSPVRVALVDSGAESTTASSQEGKGIVRVR
jgi:general secretion pathway protein D